MRLDWLFDAEKRLLTNAMPRANRHFLPGYVWHITHQCREGSSNRSIAALRSRRLIKLGI